ncbi:HAMP domain-containing sensor histidine kinase [Pleomorphovibrio marinus]|uniref:HAMP domain-containing sensor histidine kinase n=1 Tax=Pleomorphovibrio marinus TaxID=2164132 RepID=UPI000E0B1576|nr:HAMP domain-containing sensor histidine kinase [Pleomorphovibrio marinus]
MSIRKKILVYFSATVISLTALSLLVIHALFAEYREEEFQQRQKEKITTTFKFLTETQRMDSDILQSLEEVSIQKIYDEKLLIYDGNKRLIYESIDDTEIENPEYFLGLLSVDNDWIETKDGRYDVVGIYFQSNNRSYYGISKAYDAFGYTKLEFLRQVLVFTFILISVIVIFVSVYLSRKISQPITEITQKIDDYNFEDENDPIVVKESGKEIRVLSNRFNELMQRMKEAFAFQKHAIHHISHELKTPISVLVSNFERMEKENDLEKIREWINNQKEDTKSLSEIINALLEISKAETGKDILQDHIRIDEMIFDIADELKALASDFNFNIIYDKITEDERQLTVRGNQRLLKSAITNLMLNCILYSDERQAKVQITPQVSKLEVEFINKGQPLSKKDQQFLFQHFFRGDNSKGKKGFGLGLVFIHKIMNLHKGSISYRTQEKGGNIFIISLPLS